MENTAAVAASAATTDAYSKSQGYGEWHLEEQVLPKQALIIKPECELLFRETLIIY